MSQTTWCTAAANNSCMFDAWTNCSTDANQTYHFKISAGTTTDACNKTDAYNTWNWVVTDVGWHTQVVDTNSLWSSKEIDEKRKEQLKERWGVEKLPNLTAEELKEVERNSEKFLADVLSPDELTMFKAENKVRVESGLEPEVHYIVKRVRMSRIERYVKGVLVETLGFHVCWQELPELDILATKVFDLKHNEELVLGKSCRAPPPVTSR